MRPTLSRSTSKTPPTAPSSALLLRPSIPAIIPYADTSSDGNATTRLGCHGPPEPTSLFPRSLYVSSEVFTLASSNAFSASSGQRRRRSSAATHPPNLNLDIASASRSRFGTASGTSGAALGDALPTIPGTPSYLNMSRSPSPRPGGWSSPGLNTPYNTGGQTSPFANGGSQNVTWASPQGRGAEAKQYAAFNPRNQGFFAKHFRSISASLPFSYAAKEKLGRGRLPQPQLQQGNKVMQMLNRVGWNLWRLRRPLGLILVILLSYIFFYTTRESIRPISGQAS